VESLWLSRQHRVGFLISLEPLAVLHIGDPFRYVLWRHFVLWSAPLPSESCIIRNDTRRTICAQLWRWILIRCWVWHTGGASALSLRSNLALFSASPSGSFEASTRSVVGYWTSASTELKSFCHQAATVLRTPLIRWWLSIVFQWKLLYR
jgi:hypothetical protein